VEADWLRTTWERHRGKIIGAVAGLVFGLMVVYLGLLLSLFVLVCVLAGYVVGRRFDEEGWDFTNVLERLFSRGER